MTEIGQNVKDLCVINFYKHRIARLRTLPGYKHILLLMENYDIETREPFRGEEMGPNCRNMLCPWDRGNGEMSC